MNRRIKKKLQKRGWFWSYKKYKQWQKQLRPQINFSMTPDSPFCVWCTKNKK